jgi:hypothetical protein
MSINPFDDDKGCLVLGQCRGAAQPVADFVLVLQRAGGWFTGKRTALCLDYIEQIWTGIRPGSPLEGLAAGRAFD